jgi:MbtH protein
VPLFLVLGEELTVTNPFEDQNGTYHVLINEEGQYSLWPSFIEIPAGWTAALPSSSREICLQFIDRNWTDMRPNSLIASMNGSPQTDPSRTTKQSIATAPKMQDE